MTGLPRGELGYGTHADSRYPDVPERNAAKNSHAVVHHSYRAVNCEPGPGLGARLVYSDSTER
ncbi:hypothetical protein QA648_21280 (plasmid) [Rhizobium sp. CB3171]|uniref:hypothetical protein n=1 Tax=Rhizobium sp. CB3171 TaxID=3039157 RepID=UPI0024B075A1|nr:hypothetical protein [Rhizobium sp. CB3171]WFU05708.1 hypothetical protein QA648_21280 [Rhizobium sp. CB3171]